MLRYDEIRSNRNIICAMVSIGWILIYDVIFLLSSIQNINDLVFVGYEYFFGEMISIFYIIMLFSINRDLSKADNPIKYKESTDWFYEKYEDEERR